MEQTNKHYPIGVSSFPEIREKWLVYIDKTDLIYELTPDDARYVFLSRPPKFGKTPLISTLEAYFQGLKGLFSEYFDPEKKDEALDIVDRLFRA